MSRPVAHNKVSVPISGSIVNGDDVGNIVYTVDGAGNNYYDGYADRLWVPSAEGAAPIVFVTDTFTQGYTGDVNEAVPIFFACAGTSSAAIIYTANRLPGMDGQDFSTAEEALTYLTRNGYFILEGNDPFEGINADNLRLEVDASKMSSYPGGDDAWYDLSGNYNVITLDNGPTFNSGGWLTFDGTDDYGYSTSTSLNITGNVTMNAWVRNNGTGASVGNYMSKAQNNGYRIRRNGGNGSAFWIYSAGNSVNGGAIYDNIWYMVTGVFSSTGLRAYINGNLVASNSTPYSPSSLTLDSLYIGAYTVGAELFGGDIMNAQVYASALTEAEIKQNYFGSPIVTDGLVFAVDANNIVSYPKSGTSWYNLTGSVVSASLINSPTFDPTNGGTIRFDGTDEYAAVQYNSSLDITNAITVEAWVKYASQGEIGGVGRTYSVISYKGYPWTWLLEDISGQFNFRISTTSDSDSRLDSNYYHGLNNWDHVVCTYNGSTQAIYVNGVLRNSKSLTGTINTSATTIELGTYGSGDYSFNGWLANHRIYNRALTSTEILQNYQAEQYRFAGPQGIVTNGLLLYWDAGNLDSYPGTGTTIYDLSGNGNNGTLYNGVGFNQANGGVLTFDGVDDYVRSYNPNLSTTTSTVMGAARYSGATRGRMINSTDVNWLMGHWSNSTENYYAAGWVSSVGTGTSDTNWRIYAALGNQPSDAWSLYVNNTVTATSTGGVSGPDGISIGAQTYSSFQEFSTGNFSFVLVYNRVLTAAEMTQNYNYFKGRFGL